MQISNCDFLAKVLPSSFRQSHWLAWYWCAFILLLITADGCTKTSGEVPVRGHISYRGQPLAISAVTFFPAKGRPVTAAARQGEYSTNLMPGEYTAVVNVGVEYPPGFKEGDPEPAPKIVLPPEYSTRAQSKLKATVKAGQSEPVDFELK